MAYLNAENSKIIEYLKDKNMLHIAASYLSFLDAGKKLDKKDLKILSKFVRLDNSTGLFEKFSVIFPELGISIPGQTKKSSSYLRVKKHREKIKAKGYKNLSVLLPPDDYQKLKKMKISLKMTYSELISYLINQ